MRVHRPLFWQSTDGGPASLTLGGTGPAPEAQGSVVAARAELSYLPAAPGSQAAPRRDGFVVTREQLVYRAGAASGTPPERIGLRFAGHVGRAHRRRGGGGARAGGESGEPQLRRRGGAARRRHGAAQPAPRDRAAGGQGRAATLTLTPTYAAYLDDQVAFYFNELPKGTYDFYFRTRAQVQGDFIQPPAKAEMMYDGSQVGTSAGATVSVMRPAE